MLELLFPIWPYPYVLLTGFLVFLVSSFTPLQKGIRNVKDNYSRVPVSIDFLFTLLSCGKCLGFWVSVIYAAVFFRSQSVVELLMFCSTVSFSAMLFKKIEDYV